MKLSHYPQAIYNQQCKLIGMKRDFRLAQDQQRALTVAIKGEIANDASLKNATQREARELELMNSDPDLQMNQRLLAELKESISLGEADLDFLQNQFTVAKLEARELIARAEAAA